MKNYANELNESPVNEWKYRYKLFMTLNSVKKIYRERNREKKEVRKRNNKKIIF